MYAVDLESKRVCLVIAIFTIFVESTEFDLAYHHFAFPSAQLHHSFLGDQNTQPIVVAGAQLHPDDIALLAKIGEDGAACLSGL